MTVHRIALLTLLLLASAAPAAVPVIIGPLGDQLIELEVRAPATVVPANEALLTAQVTALITDVEADVGATVNRGDLLLKLDDRDARLGLDRAKAEQRAVEAQIGQAESRLKRGKDLIRDHYISDDDMLERRTTLAVLQANKASAELAVRAAELTLSRTRIYAPYNAVVVARAAQVGSLAQPGTPLVTVVQTGNREIDAELDPRFTRGIGTATSAQFESQGQRWPVALARLSSVIDTSSRVQKARFRFAGEQAAIGASGEIVWLDAAGLVPVPLIVQRNALLGVFVVDGSSARFVPLPQAQEGRPAPTSLPRDTLIVVRGQARLQDGDELQIARQ